MKRLTIFLILSLLSFDFNAQEVESIIEFELNSVIGGGERIRILDANDDYVILRVRSNDFSMSNGFTFQNPEASEVMLFCDAALNVLWSKTLISTEIHAVAMGNDAIYLLSVAWGTNGGYLGEPLGLEKVFFIAKMDFNGEWLWLNNYGGLGSSSTSSHSLALDGDENLILATALLNYDHPIESDTLVFMSDTCYCSAIDLQFPFCTTTLRWNSNGNELGYHVLNSPSTSRTHGVGADAWGNYYVNGSIDHWLGLPSFAGSMMEGGEFVLKFGADGSEQWVYNRSSQELTHNSGWLNFITANSQHAFFSVNHTSNTVVTDGNTIELEVPENAPSYLNYQTIHVLDQQSGTLDTLDFFTHASAVDGVKMLPNGEIISFGRAAEGFEHSWPPYSHTPSPSERFILSKTLFGQYNEPAIFEVLSAPDFGFGAFFSNKHYIRINSNLGPIEFAFNGVVHSTNTGDCIVILDRSSNIAEQSQERRELSVFPNPLSSGLLNVTADFPMNELFIFDVQGKLVYHRQLQSQQTAQLQPALERGFYTVHVVGDKAHAAQRLVVH